MERNCHQNKSIGVLTSGGDSQGMNSAIRAVVRMGLYLGCKVFFIKEGYQGMVDGGDNIVETKWSSVSSIIHIGGTIIGSARCMDFKERAGRLKAAENLIKRGITNLVVIGGDGSLTGANLFRVEWSSLLDELLKFSKISADEHQKYKSLQIAGIVGSIDNDFCGTDITLGADSALHRILEAVDAIVSTAYSHQRTFILEVMGRHCGYLALATSLACEADYMFIPEDPVSLDWQQKLCDKLRAKRAAGRRLAIIIIAEGAIDKEGSPISAEMVKSAVVTDLKHDTRITVLGHVQRGGNPSAADQLLGCRLGAEAVVSLLNAKEDDKACVIVQTGNRVHCIPLMEAVEKTQAVSKALNEKRFEDAIELRGPKFKRNLGIYKLFQQSPGSLSVRVESPLTFAVMHIGAPACGMNAAVHSFVRISIYRGHKVYGIYDSFTGLIAGDFKQLEWIDVTGWVKQGSAILRTNHVLPEGKFEEIAACLKEFKIQGLLAIGGFEAFHAFGQLADQRKNFPEFQIPLCVIPATIDNNVPGSEISLGVDTSVNEIVKTCRNLRLAGSGMKRTFVIETMGGHCGYLTTASGLAAGADAVYIHEEEFAIRDLQRDVSNVKQKMNDGVQRGLILRNERANENYNTDFIHRLFAEEGKDVFSTRSNIFGHWQQGGTPSPFDRNMGSKMGAQAADWMIEQARNSLSSKGVLSVNSDESACLLRLKQRDYSFVPLKSLVIEGDFAKRMPNLQWWLHFKSLLKILAMHDSAYTREEADRPLKSFMGRQH